MMKAVAIFALGALLGLGLPALAARLWPRPDVGIESLRVYDRALTEAEVAELFTKGYLGITPRDGTRSFWVKADCPSWWRR